MQLPIFMSLLILIGWGFGDEFGTELRHFLQSNPGDFALVFEGNRLYAITDEVKVLLKTYYCITDTESRSRGFDLGELQMSSIEPLLELVPFEREWAVQDRIPLAQVTLNVPTVLQGNTNLCWAASVAAVGRYRTQVTSPPFGTVRTAAQVAAEVGKGSMDTATIYETADALGQVFGIWNRSYIYSPSFAEISTSLNNGMPLIVAFTSNVDGHAVVFTGLYTSPSTQIR